MKKLIKIFVFITILILTSAELQAQAEKLKLEIGLLKEIYLIREPIWLDFYLTNISQDTLRVYGPCVHCGDTRFQVVNEAGDTLPYRGIEAQVAYGGGYLMEPGEVKYNCFNLIEYYGEIADIFRLKLKQGKYSVRAVYYGSKTAIINSEEIDLEVRKTGGSEIQALELLKQAYRAQITNEPKLAQQSFEKIIMRFPESVYSEIACKELASSDSLKLEMLRKYPNTGFVKWILRKLVRNKSKEEQRFFLQDIIDQYPNTRSAKFAEKFLKKLGGKEQN